MVQSINFAQKSIIKLKLQWFHIFSRKVNKDMLNMPMNNIFGDYYFVDVGKRITTPKVKFLSW
jgi:hypothetical protein